VEETAGRRPAAAGARAPLNAGAAILSDVKRGRLVLGLGLLFGWYGCVSITAAAPPDSIRSQDVIAHLEQVSSWYRQVTSAPPTGNVLIRDSLHQAALKALEQAFRFARAEAALIGAPAMPAPASQGNLGQASAQATDRVASIQSRIDQIETQLPKAAARQRQTLLAERKELNAELELAREIQNTVQNLVNFTGAIESGSGGLEMQVAELENLVPEVAAQKNPEPANPTSPANPSSPANASSPANESSKEPAAARTFAPESAGVVALAVELFSIHATRVRLEDLLKETMALAAAVDTLKVPLTNETKSSAGRGEQIVSQAGTQNPAQLDAAQGKLKALANRFKMLSTAIVPLGEEGIAVATTRDYLDESVRTLDQESARAGRYLLIRAATLGIAIVGLLVLSELWRRGALRYVRDARRRRQFLVIRRVVVAGAMIIALVFAFVSEFGSLATYAGLVTAGVAVALQIPILAVVSYFFLIGRYGVRVGDRVTISGVTGEVMEIGLVRIYMMELAGTPPDLHPTGRVVVFSNSVIFQPSALYKQMPGVDYVWHLATLTLAPESDFPFAEKTLDAAVESVYGRYRERIELQYASLEQSVDVPLAEPKPESRLRFTDAGLQFTVRYPVEMQHALEMDDQILRALHDAVASEPKLNFAPSGSPKLQAA
jgi:small-conductance mechanosensitive channel